MGNLPNGMLARRKDAAESGYLLGKNYWLQMLSDIASEILFDDTFMGDKVMSPTMILKFNEELGKRADYYEPALGINIAKDADIRRSQLDANMKYLVECYNEERPEGEPELPFIPFEERFPGVDTPRYDKPIKEERHPATKKHGKRRKH